MRGRVTEPAVHPARPQRPAQPPHGDPVRLEARRQDGAPRGQDGARSPFSPVHFDPCIEAQLVRETAP